MAVYVKLSIDVCFQVSPDQFLHLLKGLRSGCPPHGGIALGKTFSRCR